MVTDWRACLGSQKFEELQILKPAWRQSMQDYAAINQMIEEVVDVSKYEDFLAWEINEGELDRNLEGENEWPFDSEVAEVDLTVLRIIE